MRKIFLILLLVVFGTLAGGFWFVKWQGANPNEWHTFALAKVRFDEHGIATIKAENWDSIIESEGYVVASDRLWQMDVMRRASSGHLSEWFGESMVDWDMVKLKEDRLAVADRAAASLPESERRYCEAYARGVNRFISTHPHQVGVEYALLRATPEKWQCRDSLLIVLLMDDQLCSVAAGEAADSIWAKHLSEHWANFLFSSDHPWNEPLFGKNPHRIALPPVKEYIPLHRLTEGKEIYPADLGVTGSNNWVWRGSDAYFLANDPHMGAGVPQNWYAIRLFHAANDWVVGAALPGVPGVVLGMNAFAAWAMTNIQEDVDDYLKEELDLTKTRYVASIKPNGEKVYQALEEKRFVLKVKGKPDQELIAQFTHRGPLSTRKYLGEDFYSRQWLPYKKGMLRLPTVQLAQMHTWEEFNEAVDGMTSPPQNVLFLDRKGNFGYRASGRGVIRKVSGLIPQPALQGEWVGIEPAFERPRLWVPNTKQNLATHFLATANERIWAKGFGNHWVGEQRKDRIREVLSQNTPYDRYEMESLQRDTKSRYHVLLLKWISDHAHPSTPMTNKIIEGWKKWDGVAKTNPEIFTQAVRANQALFDLLLSVVSHHFLPEKVQKVPYNWHLSNAWLLTVLQTRGGTVAFGLREEEVADYLLAKIAELGLPIEKEKLYNWTNRWKAQHVLTRIPLLGALFRVDEFPQWGYTGLVRTELPRFGASTRLVWDLANPKNSTWSFPVGQSGHVGSTHYSDLQKDWFEGKTYPVFDSTFMN